MITMNLPQFVSELKQPGDVRVNDRTDIIQLRFANAVNTAALDDLVCDALFVDPIRRDHDKHGCTLELAKRDKPGHCSDMRLVSAGSSVRYVC